MATAMTSAALALGTGTAHADPQVIEQCHWSDSAAQWIYSDGSLCRGSGEDPTTGSDGLPACADGRLAVLQPNGRVTCRDKAGYRVERADDGLNDLICQRLALGESPGQVGGELHDGNATITRQRATQRVWSALPDCPND